MRNFRVLPLIGLLFGLAGVAVAHTPICFCYENDEGSITCEGGFSDGASAAGVSIRVLNERGRALLTGEMDDEGLYTFERPSVEFYIEFDAGESHVVTIYPDEIE